MPSIQHVVLFRFKEESSAAEIEEALNAFAQLPQLIPSVQSYQSGPNISPEGLAQGYTHCFLLSFADAAARDQYLAHPSHQAFVALVQPRLAQALVVDF